MSLESSREQKAVITRRLAVLLSLPFLVSAVSAKGPCEDYFGRVDGPSKGCPTCNLTTVVDPDVTTGWMDISFSTFVHHAGYILRS